MNVNNCTTLPANRITTVNDFGFVALDMKYSQEDDSGTYTCRATNRLGQAATSATCVVQSESPGRRGWGGDSAGVVVVTGEGCYDQGEDTGVGRCLVDAG